MIKITLSRGFALKKTCFAIEKTAFFSSDMLAKGDGPRNTGFYRFRYPLRWCRRFVCHVRNLLKFLGQSCRKMKGGIGQACSVWSDPQKKDPISSRRRDRQFGNLAFTGLKSVTRSTFPGSSINFISFYRKG